MIQRHSDRLSIVQPIDEAQREHVLRHTEKYIRLARDFFNADFAFLPVYFDLKGRIAGMYVSKPGKRYIRYNPYIFARYFEPGLFDTVPHEVAHYVVDMLHGLQHTKPHGQEWRRVMQAFGIERPRATGVYDLDGVPVRRQKRFRYVCDCREHQISSVRHYRMMRRKAVYHCRNCTAILRFTGE